MMQENKARLTGLFIFFSLLTGILIIIIYTSIKKTDDLIGSIEVTGNTLLPADTYIEFAGLFRGNYPDTLTLKIIKEKFEKHPYIIRADVKFDNDYDVLVELHEKKIKAMVNTVKGLFYCTDQFEFLKIIQGTAKTDLPFISNTSLPVTLHENKVFRTTQLVEAFRIIDAAKLLDENLWSNLSEINFSSSLNITGQNDIVLTFSGLRPVVLFGRGGEAKKMVYLQKIWQEIRNGSLQSEGNDYIDLRYAADAYLGRIEKTGFTE